MHTMAGLPDAVLLATAHVEKRVLLTRNTRDVTAGTHVRVLNTLYAQPYTSISTSLWLIANRASSSRVDTPVLSKMFDR